MIDKIKSYIELAGPQYFIIPLVGLLSGAYLAIGSINLVELLLPIFIVCVLMVSAFNSYNCIWDVGMDAISKPHRPIPSGRITQRGTLVFSIVLYILIVSLAYMLNNQLVLLLIILNALATILYSSPVIRLKNRFIITNLTITMHYGFFPIAIGWTLYRSITLIPILVLIFVLLLVLSTGITENFGVDYAGDKKHKVNTLLVVLGPKNAAKIEAVLLLMPFLWVGINVLLGMFRTQTLTIFVLLPLVIKIIDNLLKHPIGKGSETAFKYAIILYALAFIIFTIKV